MNSTVSTVKKEARSFGVSMTTGSSSMTVAVRVLELLQDLERLVVRYCTSTLDLRAFFRVPPIAKVQASRLSRTSTLVGATKGT
jgi:hypothetical protein